jgi:hypothetical protein
VIVVVDMDFDVDDNVDFDVDGNVDGDVPL